MESSTEKRFKMVLEALEGFNREMVTKDEFNQEIRNIKEALKFLLQTHPMKSKS